MFSKSVLFLGVISVYLKCSTSASINPFAGLAIIDIQNTWANMAQLFASDLMGNPFESVQQLLDNPEVKSCAKKITDIIQNPSSKDVPKCVRPEDLKALNKLASEVKKVPSKISADCVGILYADINFLATCTQDSLGQLHQLVNELYKIVKSLQDSCGSYIVEHKSEIREYFLNGCKGNISDL